MARLSRNAQAVHFKHPAADGNPAVDRDPNASDSILSPRSHHCRYFAMQFSYVTDCWFVTGPTAAGKSAVGLALARRSGGEVVSMDSMAVYRRMDIGTAKPSPADRAAIPHHLVDIVEPWDEFSLADYVAAAEAVTAETCRAVGRRFSSAARRCI